MTTAAAVTAAPLVTPAQAASTPKPAKQKYCLNTSTVMGQKLTLVQQVELAAKAGYDAIEPWIRDIEAFVKDGGQLKDIARRIADLGLTVESAIGFAHWIVNDDAERKAGLEHARRDMDLIRQIGGTRIAAPPAGVPKDVKIDLFTAAERYAALLKVGAETGVTPQVEIWGHSSNLSRIGESVFVAIESGHPNACLLPDVYHIYKGGSDFNGLKMVAGPAIHCFHMNDYPANPPRETISDKDRVYPGDGVAPLDSILQNLFATGFNGTLSLELFNPTYWMQDPEQVARTGLEKMKASVARALS